MDNLPKNDLIDSLNDKINNDENSTSKHLDALNLYLKEIRPLPILSKLEDVEISKQVEEDYYSLFKIIITYRNGSLSDNYGLNLIKKALGLSYDQPEKLIEFNLSNPISTISSGEELIDPIYLEEEKHHSTKEKIALFSRLEELALKSHSNYKKLFNHIYFKMDRAVIKAVARALIKYSSNSSLVGSLQENHLKIEAGENKLIESNLKLVVSIANGYVNNRTSLAELISPGNDGLIRAVEKYDYHRERSFTSYSVWFISLYLNYEIAKTRTPFEFPITVKDAYEKIDKLVFLAEGEGRSLTIDDISKATGYTSRYIQQVRSLFKPGISLEQAVYADNKLTIADTIADNNFDLDQKSGSKVVDKVLSTLKPVEEAVLRLTLGIPSDRPMSISYNLVVEKGSWKKERTEILVPAEYFSFEEKTLEEVGQYLGSDRKTIWYFKNTALKKLARKHSLINLLRDQITREN